MVHSIRTLIAFISLFAIAAGLQAGNKLQTKDIQQNVAPRSVFFVGHSLINWDMPNMLDAIAKSLGKTHYTYNAQIINGSPLKYNWQNAHSIKPSAKGFNLNSRKAIASNQFNTLVITEAIPLDNHIQWSNSKEYAHKFHALFVAAETPSSSTVNNARASYLFETWHCINSGTKIGCPYDEADDSPWDERIKNDLTKWQNIARYASQNTPGKHTPMVLIPAGQSLLKLSEAIDNKQVAGISSIRELFVDDIHLGETGNYFIALVFYSTIFKESPEGASHKLKTIWGGKYKRIPSKDEARVLQKIAWESVSSYFKW